MPQTYQVNITVTGQDHASKPLGNVSGALNTLAGVAGGVLLANGLSSAADMVLTAGKNAVSAASDMQRFNISLDTLAARELVASGAADNIGQALQQVGPITDELTVKLRELGLTSPFSFETIQSTFRLQMAFGQTSDQSIKLTGAILDTASALGLGAEETDRLAYNFAQINSVGKIMGTDLRQLRMVGLDLAAVFKDQLGMSVEEVNAALESGALTMKDVSDAFVNYASVNFAGAAERMSMTAQGLKSSFGDLFYFLSTDLLGSSLETVTGYLQEFFATARDLQASGYFTQLGEEVNENVKRIMNVFQDMLGADGPEQVLKKIGDAIVNVSDKIADALEWWNGLDDSTKKLIGDVALFALAFGPVLGMFNTAKGVIGAAGVVLKSFGATASASIGVLSPLALAIGATVLAIQAYNKVQQIADEGTKRARNSYQEFFNTVKESAPTAADALAAYLKKQQEVNQILEEANPIVRAIVRSQMGEIDTGRMLSEVLIATGDEYYNYLDAMAAAGEMESALTQYEYEHALMAVENQDVLVRSSQTWSEYSTAMTNAGLSADIMTREEFDLAKASEHVGETMSMSQGEIDAWRNSLAESTPVVEGLGDEFSWLADDVTATDYAMAMLKSNMAGELGAEIESFNGDMRDLYDELGNVNGQIATLEGMQYLTGEQRTQLDDLQSEHDGIIEKIRETERAHTEQTNTIIFNLAQQQLAMSGLDASTQLQIMEDMAQEMGLIDIATQSANVAIQTLVSSTNEQNAGNLADAIAFIGQAAADGKVTVDELNTALDILNGKTVTTSIEVEVDYQSTYDMPTSAPSTTTTTTTTAPSTYVPIGGYYENAVGGSYLVDKPTLFLAGEGNEPEYADFTPRSQRKNNQPGGRGDTYHIYNRDRASAALTMAWISQARAKRLDAEMGR